MEDMYIASIVDVFCWIIAMSLILAPFYYAAVYWYISLPIIAMILYWYFKKSKRHQLRKLNKEIAKLEEEKEILIKKAYKEQLEKPIDDDSEDRVDFIDIEEMINDRGLDEEISLKVSLKINHPVAMEGIITIGEDGDLPSGTYDMEIQGLESVHITINSKDGERILYQEMATKNVARNIAEDYFRNSIKNIQYDELNNELNKFMKDYDGDIVKSIYLEEGYTIDTNNQQLVFTKIK